MAGAVPDAGAQVDGGDWFVNIYVDIDEFVVDWLDNLQINDYLPHGHAVIMDITKARPFMFRNYTQVHLFASIGGWPLALRMAGWPDDMPVWTGSPPCQPFSNAGKRKGMNDERHLWPAFFDLIRECRPPVIFGEQVENAARHGWLDALQADLEGAGYAFGAAVLPAASVGAPHIRHRIFFVAERVSDTGFERLEGWKLLRECTDEQSAGTRGMESGMGNADIAGRDPGREAAAPARYRHSYDAAGWDDLEWLECSDGKVRPTQPGLFPLADGVPARVGRLRAYGNAIVPQVAVQFVKAYLDSRYGN